SAPGVRRPASRSRRDAAYNAMVPAGGSATKGEGATLPCVLALPATRGARRVVPAGHAAYRGRSDRRRTRDGNDRGRDRHLGGGRSGGGRGRAARPGPPVG